MRLIFTALWLVAAMIKVFSFEVTVKRGGDFSSTFRDSLKILDGKTPYQRVDNLYFNKKFPIYFPNCYLVLAGVSYLTGRDTLEEIREIWIPIGKAVFILAVLGLWRLLSFVFQSTYSYYVSGLLCFSAFGSKALHEISVSHFELWTFGLVFWGIVLILKYKQTVIGGLLLGLSLSFKQALLPLYPLLILLASDSRAEARRIMIGFLIPVLLFVVPFFLIDPVQFIKATIVFHLTRVDTNTFFGYRVPSLQIFLPDALNFGLYGMFALFYFATVLKSWINFEKTVAWQAAIGVTMFVFLSNRVMFKQYYVNLCFAVIILLVLAVWYLQKNRDYQATKAVI